MFSALSKMVNLPCFLLFPKHSTWQPAPLFTDKPAALIVFTFADCFHNVTGETSLHLAASPSIYWQACSADCFHIRWLFSQRDRGDLTSPGSQPLYLLTSLQRWLFSHSLTVFTTWQGRPHFTWQPAPLFTDKPAALIVFTFADCFHNVTGETSLHLAASPSIYWQACSADCFHIRWLFSQCDRGDLTSPGSQPLYLLTSLQRWLFSHSLTVFTMWQGRPHFTWQPAPLFTDKPAALIVFTFADCFHNVTGETSLHLAASPSIYWQACSADCFHIRWLFSQCDRGDLTSPGSQPLYLLTSLQRWLFSHSLTVFTMWQGRPHFTWQPASLFTDKPAALIVFTFADCFHNVTGETSLHLDLTSPRCCQGRPHFTWQPAPLFTDKPAALIVFPFADCFHNVTGETSLQTSLHLAASPSIYWQACSADCFHIRWLFSQCLTSPGSQPLYLLTSLQRWLFSHSLTVFTMWQGRPHFTWQPGMHELMQPKFCLMLEVMPTCRTALVALRCTPLLLLMLRVSSR